MGKINHGISLSKVLIALMIEYTFFSTYTEKKLSNP